VSDQTSDQTGAEAYKRDFWIKENRKHIPAHYRLRKCGRIVNDVARGAPCDLLDVGCGPATLSSVLRDNIRYYGIDIALHAPAPNLRESDILSSPIGFDGMTFDIVVAQGLFEYVGDMQSRKFAEIAQVLRPGGRFVVSYTNFGHRARNIFEAYSNVMPMHEFRDDLARFFTIDRCFPASHNWYGGQPARKPVMAVNMVLNANIPVVSPRLAVEYFFVCSARRGPMRTGGDARRGEDPAAPPGDR
jgi:SAM-dependent methyltransferase